MPFMIQERPPKSGRFWVFKQDADGNPTGSAKNKKPYSSHKAAEPYLKALYAAMKKKGEAVSELDLTVLSPDGAGLDPVLSQESVSYSETSTDPNERCGNCVFFAGGNFCYLVASYPLQIVANGWCEEFTQLEVLTDPAGVVQMSDLPKDPTEAVVEATVRAALEDFVISEYKGSVPEVPDAPGINKAELIKGDPNPTFVIRPIAQVGRTSKNGILYDQALIDSIRDQINTNHTIGIFGHIKETDRSTAHPMPQAYWIGAKQYGDKLYAKAYIADPARAADIRRKKALNSADGTSIYGTGMTVTNSDGASLMRNFVLESLDFAPVDRASLDMGKEMHIASEMGLPGDALQLPLSNTNIDPDNDGDNDLQDPNEGNEKESAMAGEVMDPLVAMTANWKSMSSDAVCEQLTQAIGAETMGKVAEAVLAKQNKKVVAAEMEVVDHSVITEMQKNQTTIAELQVQVSELNAANVNLNREKFNRALVAEIATATPYAGADAKMQKATLETRRILEMSARLTLDGKTDSALVAETVKQAITDNPALMEMWRDTLMGPAARVIGTNNHTPDASRYYSGVDVTDPKVQEAARINVGF